MRASSLRQLIKHDWAKRIFSAPFSIRRKGAAILAVPTAVTLLTVAAWVGSRQRQAVATGWVIHTQSVLSQSSELLVALVDAETGVRGFGLTQKAVYLDPYNQAQSAIEFHFQNLSQLTEDNPTQQANLAVLQEQIERYLSQLATARQIIAERDTDQPLWQSDELQQLWREGKTNLDALRASIEDISQVERHLLIVRQQKLARLNRWVDGLLIISVLMTLTSYAWGLYLYAQADQTIATQNQQLVATNHTLTHLNEQLQQRNQDLDDFTHTVSHDLKAPLRAINNLSAWIAEDLELPESSEEGQKIALLQSRVTKMNRLIEGLLSYSRVGRTANSLEQVNVGELVREVVDSLDIPKPFEVIVAQEFPTLLTERLPLEQIFSNLISNSYKHHHRENGQVTITAEPQGDRLYRFSVIDDGPGIAPEYQARIFNMFQTLSTAASDSTGIGLAIVKKIVERRGGQLELLSERGKGTAFYFTWAAEPSNEW